MLTGFSKLLDSMNNIDNYENRKLMRIDPEDNGGIGVSTADTSDMGFETALLDQNGVHPVERYENEEDAKLGHVKWVEFAKKGKEKPVIKLGYSDLVTEKEIILRGVKIPLND